MRMRSDGGVGSLVFGITHDNNWVGVMGIYVQFTAILQWTAQ